MSFLRNHRMGFIIGFLFGTVGLFVLALISLISPAIETLVSPLLLPGKWMASMIAGPSASTLVVLFLYLCTGIFYAVIGTLLHALYRLIPGATR